MLFCSCANTIEKQIPAQPVESDPYSNDILLDNNNITSAHGDETTGFIADELNIEFGRIYTIQEYLPIYEIMQSEARKQLCSLNDHFEEDVSSGKIPRTIEFNYLGEIYELSLNCDCYTNIERPSVKYRNPLNKISITVDAETLGFAYYYLVTSAFASTFPVSNLEKKTEDELIRISNEFFEPFFSARQISPNDYSIFLDLMEGELSHTDISAKRYHIRYLYNNRHSLFTRLAHITIDEFGFITTATFLGDRYLDEAFITKLPEIDYEKILEKIETYREPQCDCELSIQTQVTKRVINERDLAQLQITIVPDEKGSTEHIHDYINNSLFVFYELTD